MGEGHGAGREAPDRPAWWIGGKPTAQAQRTPDGLETGDLTGHLNNGRPARAGCLVLGRETSLRTRKPENPRPWRGLREPSLARCQFGMCFLVRPVGGWGKVEDSGQMERRISPVGKSVGPERFAFLDGFLHTFLHIRKIRLVLPVRQQSPRPPAALPSKAEVDSADCHPDTP
jgi:hypothetical protein